MKLTRNLFIPCLDVNKGVGTASYKPIDLSTIFELSWNPTEETYGYICDANDTTETTGYAPELPQEIVLESTNDIYQFVDELFWEFPVGSAATVPCLIVRPDSNGAPTVGMLWKKATISPTALNTVDGKYTYSLKLNGDPTPGTVAISGSTITFTP